MAAKSPIVIGQFFPEGGMDPSPVFTKRVSFGENDTADTFDVAIDGTGIYNLLEIVPGLHILDIKIEKADGLAAGAAGSLPCSLLIGDSGDADRFFTDTGIKPDASGAASLAVDGVAALRAGYRYADTVTSGTYIYATLGANNPLDGKFLINFIYALKKGVTEDL